MAWLSLSILELKIPLGYIGVSLLILDQGYRNIHGTKIRDNHVSSAYQIHPDIARIRVFRGEEPTEEEWEKTRSNIPGTWLPNPHSNRTANAFFISLSISILAGYASYLFMFSLIVIPSLIAVGLDLLGPLLVFSILFEVLYVGCSRYLKGQDKSKSNQEYKIE